MAPARSKTSVAMWLAGALGSFGIVVGVWLAADDSPTLRSEVVVYGDDPSQFGRLWFDPASATDRPVVVLFHGGFWRRDGGDLSLMDPLAEQLAGAGFVVFNAEYGRVGEASGGWPHTFDHVEAVMHAIDELAREYPIDMSRIGVLGHSAGGTLALWTGRLEDPPDAIVALAPIVDLDLAADERLGNGALLDLLGGTRADVPARYDATNVEGQVSAPTLLITSPDDDDVERRYSRGLTGSLLEELSVEGDHLSLIRPHQPASDHALGFLVAILEP